MAAEIDQELSGPFTLARAAILRHLRWAGEFMSVGDDLGVAEEIRDARAIASEIVLEEDSDALAP